MAETDQTENRVAPRDDWAAALNEQGRRPRKNPRREGGGLRAAGREGESAHGSHDFDMILNIPVTAFGGTGARRISIHQPVATGPRLGGNSTAWPANRLTCWSALER